MTILIAIKEWVTLTIIAKLEDETDKLELQAPK